MVQVGHRLQAYGPVAPLPAARVTGTVITVEQFCFYSDRALDAQIEILRDLGDRLVNSRPDLPGANTPYVIVHHCLAVMAYWGGHVVAGRESRRDRPGEFTASVSVFELIERAQRARTQLRDDF
jgi:hypothetical protein